MCRILLFIFLATALYAEDTKKKSAPSKASLNQLDSYNKELTKKISALIETPLDLQKPRLNQEEIESLQKAFISHPEYIFELAISLRPELASQILPKPEKDKRNFEKKDFYTAYCASSSLKKMTKLSRLNSTKLPGSLVIIKPIYKAISQSYKKSSQGQ